MGPSADRQARASFADTACRDLSQTRRATAQLRRSHTWCDIQVKIEIV